MVVVVILTACCFLWIGWCLVAGVSLLFSFAYALCCLLDFGYLHFPALLTCWVVLIVWCYSLFDRLCLIILVLCCGLLCLFTLFGVVDV